MIPKCEDELRGTGILLIILKLLFILLNWATTQWNCEIFEPVGKCVTLHGHWSNREPFGTHPSPKTYKWWLYWRIHWFSYSGVANVGIQWMYMTISKYIHISCEVGIACREIDSLAKWLCIILDKASERKLRKQGGFMVAPDWDFIDGYAYRLTGELIS